MPHHFAGACVLATGLLLSNTASADDLRLVSLSYKHFSNAGLASPNEAFDVPVLLTVGRRGTQ